MFLTVANQNLLKKLSHLFVSSGQPLIVHDSSMRGIPVITGRVIASHPILEIFRQCLQMRTFLLSKE